MRCGDGSARCRRPRGNAFLVPDPMHLARIGIKAARAVAQNRVVLPAAFPELVHHLHIFFGSVVALVVLDLLRQAHAARRAVEIAGDDVPADPPAGEMVQRRHAAGEEIGRLIGEVGGHAEADCFVTAAMAGMTSSGSLTGTCTAWAMEGSGLSL